MSETGARQKSVLLHLSCSVMKKYIRYIIVLVAVIMTACSNESREIKILAWAGVRHDCLHEALPVLKESGVDYYLSHCGTLERAMEYLDAGLDAGLMIIPGLPELKDSTEKIVAALKEHPALLAYNVKDEPELWDISWLRRVNETIKSLDPEHPTYINLYPDWAWGGDSYETHINIYADSLDTPFYSFDQYPVMRQDAFGNPYDGEGDAIIVIRDTWYRNLEVFSKMARERGRPFWAFAMAKSHHLGPPSPPAFYPVPTLGHLRLQVFSDLLYGAQVIQYFTANAIYDSGLREKASTFDVIKKMNDDIKSWSPVFAGCTVRSVCHHGGRIPLGASGLESMPHRKLLSLDWEPLDRMNASCHGLLVSLLENDGREYLAVQNKDCENTALLNAAFKGKVRIFNNAGAESRKAEDFNLMIEPGNIVVFEL